MSRRKPSPPAEWVPIESLAPWSRNPRINADAVPVIMRSLESFGFGRPLVAWRSKAERRLVVGHTTYAAYQRLASKHGEDWHPAGTPGPGLVPVRWRDDWTEAEASGYAIADNKTAEISLWDEDVLSELLVDLADEVNLDALGFDVADLDSLEATQDEDLKYTSKITLPVYEPKGNKPPVSSLIDTTKTDELLEAIDSREDLPADVERFLRAAAMRHTVFHFGQIAEFYCHADQAVQDLMERSALVIIDYEKAIEGGFVKLTESIQSLVSHESTDES